MENLHRYHQATVGLWRRAQAELRPLPGQECVTWCAVHGVLAGLRRQRDLPALLAAFESSPAADADFALARSLLPEVPASPLFDQIREAAFYLRWRELGGGP